MECVIYLRVSTDEQNPKSQYQVVMNYVKQKGYTVVKVFEENISGSVHPLKRKKFREMIEFCRENNIAIIVMYDLTRFYRGSSAMEVMNTLSEVMKMGFIVEFATEPQIQDPMLAELWNFIKSWYSAYERMMIVQRTKAGILRLKNSGRLYHRPTILHYYASAKFDKDIGEITVEDLNAVIDEFIGKIEKYILEFGKQNALKEFVKRDPIMRKAKKRYGKKIATSYWTLYRILKRNINS